MPFVVLVAFLPPGHEKPSVVFTAGDEITSHVTYMHTPFTLSPPRYRDGDPQNPLLLSRITLTRTSNFFFHALT